MTLPIHPLVLKAVPETSELDRSKMREGIRKSGLIQAIVTSKGYIIDGRTRQQICDELGVEARYTEYDGTLPIAEYILQTNLRRNLTPQQLDSMILTLGREVVPQMRAEAKAAKNNGQLKGGMALKKASNANESEAPENSGGQTQKRFRKLVGHVRKADQTLAVLKHEDLAAAVEAGATSLKDAAKEAVSRYREGRDRPNSKKVHTHVDPSANQIKWQAIIDAPSTFPVDAVIPKGDGPEERQVREAIRIARENEAGIGSFSRGKLQTLIWENTNCIQGYCENRHKRPRPEGLLDPRLLEWAKNVARRHQARQLIIQEHEIVNKANGSNGSQHDKTKRSRKKLTGFEAVFRRYWQKEKPLLRDLRMYGFETFSERWLKEAAAYFPEVGSK